MALLVLTEPATTRVADAVETVESLAENLRAAVEWGRSPSPDRSRAARPRRSCLAWQRARVDAVLAADRLLPLTHNAIAEPDAWLHAVVVMWVHYAFVRGGAAVSESAQPDPPSRRPAGADPFALAAARWIERSDVERSATIARRGQNQRGRLPRGADGIDRGRAPRRA